MARRKTSPPEVRLTRWFAHKASDFVDVFPNADGEFVQVWTAPRGTPQRFVTLSYQRTPDGPIDITSTIHLGNCEWSSMEITGPKRKYFYSPHSSDFRYEEILPSGRMLVGDRRHGQEIRVIWTAEFDWHKSRPKGRQLRDRAVQKRQCEGAPIFVTSYQQILANGEIVDETLICVEEYLGKQFVRIYEYPSQCQDNEDA